MERPTGDVSGTGGAIVPETSSMVPTTGTPAEYPAGTSPTPMTVDDGIFYQPVQTYFQFVQNNLTYINVGNIDLFRHEGEERHTQIMEQMVQQLHQDYENRSMAVEQMCFNELARQPAEADNRHEQMVSELTGFMMSRTVAEQEILNLRKELSEANATEERCKFRSAGSRAKGKPKGFSCDQSIRKQIL